MSTTAGEPPGPAPTSGDGKPAAFWAVGLVVLGVLTVVCAIVVSLLAMPKMYGTFAQLNAALYGAVVAGMVAAFGWLVLLGVFVYRYAPLGRRFATVVIAVAAVAVVGFFAFLASPVGPAGSLGWVGVTLPATVLAGMLVPPIVVLAFRRSLPADRYSGPPER